MNPKEKAMKEIIKIESMNFKGFQELVDEYTSRKIDIALQEQTNEILIWYKEQWDNGNPVSPKELEQYLKGGREC